MCTQEHTQYIVTQWLTTGIVEPEEATVARRQHSVTSHTAIEELLEAVFSM
jgi:hypothetical protein